MAARSLAWVVGGGSERPPGRDGFSLRPVALVEIEADSHARRGGLLPGRAEPAHGGYKAEHEEDQRPEPPEERTASARHGQFPLLFSLPRRGEGNAGVAEVMLA